MQTVLVSEFKTVSAAICAVLQFVQCSLKMSLNDVNKLGTIAYEEVVHVKRAFDTRGYTIELIFSAKSVTESMLPCGTPISWSNTSEICKPNLIWNCLF